MARIPSARKRAFAAAGLQCGDIVLNCFSYHLTPGGFIIESGAHALGCAVIPAGPGNTEQTFAGDRAATGRPPMRGRRTS